ncbi:MAG TPA: response regulator transcription factor [Burkholderiaceae bacterium]|nr:response regulator transcription factor [Burkholderiaceae bacterium]
MPGDSRNPSDAARRTLVAPAWRDVFEELRRADDAHGLDAEELEKLAWSAGMLDRDTELLPTLERLYQVHLDAGRPERAAYWAFFLGFRLLALREFGRATAWFQRTQRLADELGRDSAIHGYLLIPAVYKLYKAGDLAAAQKLAAEAVEIGDRCREPDLAAFARCQLGRLIACQGDVDAGIALLDEAMLAATARELTPVLTGLVYCNVISTCRQVFALDRAREWTSALAHWCDAQPQLVQFNGICRIHRAEIMELTGAWPEAVAEARHAAQSVARAVAQETKAAAAYQEGEIHRLRGEFASAEEAYKEASRCGQEPQPGLALLRLMQGRTDQAAAAIRRCVAATADPLERLRLLPAAVEILLAADARDEAKAAGAELEEVARRFGTDVLVAMAAQARGAIELAGGDAAAALSSLREALATWHRLDAPYLVARVRVQAGLACRALDDDESARLEFEAAQQVFMQLGAAPDLARLAALQPVPRPRTRTALTAREIEVLRLVAAGRTNRGIAKELSLSEKTVDRHLSNIFDKLDVTSRAAATAHAIHNGLL